MRKKKGQASPAATLEDPAAKPTNEILYTVAHSNVYNVLVHGNTQTLMMKAYRVDAERYRERAHVGRVPRRPAFVEYSQPIHFLRDRREGRGWGNGGSRSSSWTGLVLTPPPCVVRARCQPADAFPSSDQRSHLLRHHLLRRILYPPLCQRSRLFRSCSLLRLHNHLLCQLHRIHLLWFHSSRPHWRLLHHCTLSHRHRCHQCWMQLLFCNL